MGQAAADTVLEGDRLSVAAQEVIREAETVPEVLGEVQAVEGDLAASEAAGLFEASGVLPVLGGGVLAFGLGTMIGSAICNSILGLTGCWGYSEPSEPPFDPAGVHWSYQDTKWCYGSSDHCVRPYEPFAYYGSAKTPWQTWGAPLDMSECARPVGALGDNNIFGAQGKCGHGSVVESPWQAWTKDVIGGAQGRRLEAVSLAHPGLSELTGKNYCPVGGPCAASSPVDWPTRVAKVLADPGSAGLDQEDAGGLAQTIGSRVPGSGVADPYAVMVPSCDGETSVGCVQTLEELGLAVEEKYLTWQTAVIPESIDLDDPVESLEAQAERVQQLQPKAGTVVNGGSTVVVTSNPAVDDMPIVVPRDPAPGETPEKWLERRIGPMVAPDGEVTVTAVPLGEVSMDPHYSPETVVRPVVQPGTRVDPHASTEIKVRTNPSTAPEPGAGTAPWSPPGIDPIDLSPIADLHVGCSSFPFGIFCWLKDGLTSWGPGGECPAISIPFVRFDQGPEAGEFEGARLDSSTCGFEPAMEIIRPTLVALACISIAAMFAYAALGIGGQAGSED